MKGGRRRTVGGRGLRNGQINRGVGVKGRGQRKGERKEGEVGEGGVSGEAGMRESKAGGEGGGGSGLPRGVSRDEGCTGEVEKVTGGGRA